MDIIVVNRCTVCTGSVLHKKKNMIGGRQKGVLLKPDKFSVKQVKEHAL